jgi:hypothetical protein
MSRIFLLFLSCLFFSSCTVYTEKQSEALSRTVYATKDSFDHARLDLAEIYSVESTRLVKPPKKRIDIKPVYKKNIDVLASQNKKSPQFIDKQRVVIIPEKYKSDTVVVVNSKEYENLLKEKEIYEQMKKDLDELSFARSQVDEELIRQMEYKDKMIKDLNIMQKKLVEKDLAILQRNIIIVGLIILIAAAIYLRIKGVL